MKRLGLGVMLVLALAGCRDDDRVIAVRDVTPPAAPRGLYTVTGDGQVRLSWLANTESDVAGYKVYVANCAGGAGCPYLYVLTTSGTSAVVNGLSNGVTRYFAVAAFDHAGNEGLLSGEPTNEYHFDTPRPAGYGLALGTASGEPTIAGVDFSAYGTPTFRQAWDGADVDIFFDLSGGQPYMFAAFTDTDIQDDGYASSLDATDWAPDAGWSPDGTVQLVPGHNYVVWTHDNHYAKFRVIGIAGSPARLTLDWAYQTDPGNPELAAQRPRNEGPRVRRAFRPNGPETPVPLAQ